MFCENCGANVLPGQNFCSRCGRRLAAELHPPTSQTPPRTSPLPFAETRLEKHLKIVAILWLVISAFRLLPAFGLLFGSGFAMHFMPFGVRSLLMPFAGVITLFLLAGSVAGILAGWGLLKCYPWARVLALVLGAISLIHFPLGTALGIYTLWVLLPSESEREYRRLASTSS